MSESHNAPQESNVAEQVAKLAQLHSDGHLPSDEFAKLKSNLVTDSEARKSKPLVSEEFFGTIGRLLLFVVFTGAVGFIAVYLMMSYTATQEESSLTEYFQRQHQMDRDARRQREIDLDSRQRMRDFMEEKRRYNSGQ